MTPEQVLAILRLLAQQEIVISTLRQRVAELEAHAADTGE